MSGAQSQPCSAHEANHCRTRPSAPCRRNLRRNKAGFDGVSERDALAQGGESEEFLALEAQIVDGVVDPVRGYPGGTAADSR